MGVRKLIKFSLFIYFLLAFSIYTETIPHRPLLMTAILGFILLLQGFSLNFKLYKSSYIGFLFAIIWLDFIANFIAGTNILSHFVYSLQYTLLIIVIINFCMNDNGIFELASLLFFPIMIGGPIIGFIQLIQGRYLFGSQEGDFLDTVMSNVMHENSNYVAAGLLFCTFISLHLYFRGKKICFFTALFSSICLILTYSRVAILVLAISLFLVVFIKFKEHKKLHKATLTARTLLSASVFSCILLIASPYILSIIKSYIESSDLSTIFAFKTESTFSLRYNQWVASVKILFANSPFEFLFGYGDNASKVMGNITGYTMSSHNFIFGSFAQTGILGGICALMLYIKSIWNCIKHRHKMSIPFKCLTICLLGLLACYLMISIISWQLIILWTICNVIFIRIEKGTLE